MPFLLLVTLAIDVLFIVHVVRTGRQQFWIWVILGFPVLGVFAYVAAEILPEWLRGPAAHKARARAVEAIDPERAYRAACQQLEISDTIDNRRAVAREAIQLGRAAEAQELLQAARQGMYADDPALLVALAEAHFAAGQSERCVATLNELRTAHPDFQSAEAHLLYARALEEGGRRPEALAEYAALVGYYPGEEARWRRSEALAAAGDEAAARAVCEEIVRAVERSPAYYRRAQRQWYDLAKRRLGP